MILKTKQLTKSFGGLKAMDKVDFELKKRCNFLYTMLEYR